MARPKGTRPPKSNICLTISEQTREELTILSQEHGKSISELVAQWASEQIKNINITSKSFR